MAVINGACILGYAKDICHIGMEEVTRKKEVSPAVFLFRDNVMTRFPLDKNAVATFNTMLKGLVNKCSPDAIAILLETNAVVGDATHKNTLYAHVSTPEWDLGIVLPFCRNKDKAVFEDPIFMEDPKTSMFEGIWLDKILFN